MINLNHISITNFKGPLPLLLYLIQKEELDIFDVRLKELTIKYLEEITDFNIKHDCLEYISFLLLIKSRKLLPQETRAGCEDIAEMRTELISKLLEFMTFKEVGESLLEKEKEEGAFYKRALSPFERKKGLGLEDVAIEDLVSKVQELLEQAKTQEPKRLIWDETWEVQPTMEWLETTLQTQGHLEFTEIFSSEKNKGELIVLFLAILELLKIQKIQIDSDLWIRLVPEKGK